MSHHTPDKPSQPSKILLGIAALILFVVVALRDGVEPALNAALSYLGLTPPPAASLDLTPQPPAAATRPAKPTIHLADLDPTAPPPTAKPTRPAKPSPTSSDTSELFDFYVLALSWSPDYCATQGDDDPQQCSLGRKLGFVLHGLWPQYERGYPSDCSTQQLPDSIKAQFPGLYPSPALYDHEWEKHGTCSGLDPQAYLALSKTLKDAVIIPKRYRSPEKPLRVTVEALKEDFVAANSDLDADALAVHCSGSGRYLTELYVCFSADGQLRACSAEVHKQASKSCQNDDFLVRNVR